MHSFLYFFSPPPFASVSLLSLSLYISSSPLCISHSPSLVLSLVQHRHPVSEHQNDFFYVTIVDEVFILNICSYLIFFFPPLNSLSLLYFIDVSFAY